jgi:dienelactone hydrolase
MNARHLTACPAAAVVALGLSLLASLSLVARGDAASPATVPAAAPATRPAARTVRVAELPLRLDGATPLQAEWLKAFVPPTAAFDAVLSDAPADDDVNWRLVRVTFPSPVVSPWPENNVVPGELYLPARPTAGKLSPAGKLPAAVVLDILDGSAIVPRALARGLAEQGVAALYIPMACYGVRRPAGNVHYAYFADHPDRSPDNLRQTVMDVRRAKAVLSALPDVDAARVSITGVSMGGIMTALAAGVDGTFYRVVPVMAGGDIAAITFHCREARQIKAACLAKGIDQRKLADILRPVDPLTFANRIDPATCLMINAALDEVIPRATTDALNKGIGGPRMLMFQAGHYGAAFYLLNIRQAAVDFIRGQDVESLDRVGPR